MINLMEGKRGVVIGVANERSIAWGIADVLAKHGAELAITYQTESFEKRVKPLAKSIGSRLAKDAICLEIDNTFYDLSTKFSSDISIRIVTNSDPDALHILRHSSAHILAQAVLNIYPDAKYGVGPSIDNGFYYDLSLIHI